MNLLNKLTLKNLKMNKKRTIVTIIGIILSTALITGTAGLVTSFQKSVVEYYKTNYGNYHYEFKDVPKDELKYIKNNRNIEDYYLTSSVGYAVLEGSVNTYKPYMKILAFDNKALEESSIQLLKGRMPKNDSEIVISEHIVTNGRVELEIGDEITLDVFDRIATLDFGEGEIESAEETALREYVLDQDTPYVKEEENKKTKFTKKYKIVGVIKRPNRVLEPYSAPGYTVVTYLDDSDKIEKANIYTLYNKKGLKNQNEVTADILGLDSEKYEKYMVGYTDDLEEYEKLTEIKRYEFNVNNSLLSYSGYGENNGTMKMLYSVGGIIIAIIIVASIFCIRNSFAISITEKMKQYGMLASVGATSKQIKKNVLYEAGVLALIGIPIGILSGVVAIITLLKIVQNILGNYISGMSFTYTLPISAVLLTIFLSVITIYLSARSSARKAAKVSPIEAIRSNQDIKIKRKKVKSPRIIKKIFGIGGDIAYKNLKRSRRKYRTTVISIVVSITIFIALSSFIQYAFNMSSFYYVERDYNVRIYSTSEDNASRKDEYETYKEIAKQDGVKKYSIERCFVLNMKLEDIKYSKAYTPYIENQEQTINEEQEEYISVYSVGEEEYQRFIKKLGLKESDCQNKGILIDDFMNIDSKGKQSKKRIYDFKEGERIVGRNSEDDKSISIEIAKRTDKRPMGFEGVYYSGGFIIVSDEFMDKIDYWYLSDLNVEAKNPTEFCNMLYEDYKNDVGYINFEEQIKEENGMILVVSIFLYGFITVITLIGVTNVFNTITTNMNLRSKEFATLKSIGMTKNEFNKMIRLENLFYGTKSLVIGSTLGIILSICIYKRFCVGMYEIKYILPTKPIIISIIFVFLLIGIIMHYSLNKINKQNIIETIRNDNI